MKSNCEMCGKELRFFERGYKIENSKLGLQYDSLCSNCNKKVKSAVEIIERIDREIYRELHENLTKYAYASGDVGVLIFLAVKELFTLEPDFASSGSLIDEIYFPEERDSVLTYFDKLIRIVYKILREGFSPILGRYGLDTFEAFAAYMGTRSLFVPQVRANSGEDNKIVYVELFVCEAGFVFAGPSVHSIFINRDRTVKFEVKDTESTYDFILTKQRFKDLKENPTVYFNREESRNKLVALIETFNAEKKSRIQDELAALINNLNVKIEKDLREMHPHTELRSIPLDSVLVATIKTLFEEDISQEYVKEAPDGLLRMIIDRYYPVNFLNSGITSLDKLSDYIDEKCEFVEGFEASYGNSEPVSSFAFLTPSAYMIKPYDYDEAFIQARRELPNDLYTEYQYMIYQGEPEFYITTAVTEKNPEGYYFMTGVRIKATEKKTLEALEAYFSPLALDYYQTELKKEQNKTEAFRDNEIANAVREVFSGYGYLPFTIYDEWAEVQRSLRKADLLMGSLIPEREPKSGTRDQKIFYAARTVNLFEQQASKLAESLEIAKLPVARGLLWGALKEEIIRTATQEFIRLCGDVVSIRDSLEDAFIKYSALREIDTEKAYYLGLFIYYLMNKGVLLPTDLLDHYGEAVAEYLRLNPEKGEEIEFSELTAPEHRAFDAEVIDFSKYQFGEEEQEEERIDSFLLGIQMDEDDTDSRDELALSLESSLKEED